MLHAGLVFLLVADGTTLASTGLDMGVTVSLLCKCLSTMYAAERLRATMHTNVIHDVADFKELPTASDTDKNLIRTTCNEVVAEYLDETFGDVLIKFIALCFKWYVLGHLILLSILLLLHHIGKL